MYVFKRAQSKCNLNIKFNPFYLTFKEPDQLAI